MRQNAFTAGIVGMGLALALAAPGLAAKTAKSEQAPHRSIPQIMREYGFKHKTANWTSVSTQKEENGKTSTSEAKVWISGDKYRMETKDKQNGKTMIMIDDGKQMIMVNSAEKKAFVWGPDAEAMFGSILNSDLVAESARQRKTAKKVGSEVLEGKPCAIYAYKSTLTVMNNTVSSDVKEWLWTAEQFPIKTVVNTPKYQMKIMFMTQDVPASETTNVVKDLVLDKPVDESLFSVPAGIKIETLDMPEGRPGMGGGEAGASASKRKPASAPADEGDDSEDGDGQQEQPPVDVNKLIKSFF